MYEIKYTKTFEESLEALTKTEQRKIFERIEKNLAENPQISAPMRNLPRHLTGLRKYRVGDLRIFYRIKNRNVVVVDKVSRRDTAYRDLF